MDYIDPRNINEIHIELSSNCRLSCLHCSGSEMLNAGRNGYDPTLLTPFLSAFSPQNCHVYITGGEPLLSDQLLPFVRLCRNQGFLVGLFTTFNAEQSFEQLEKLRFDLHDFYLSLYDIEAEKHDAITQTPGSFTKSISAMERAISLGITARVNFVILKSNCDRLFSILRKIDALGVAEIRLLKLVKHGSALKNWDLVGMDTAKQYACAQAIYRERDSFRAKITLSGFPTVAACRPFPSAFACGAGKTLLYVDNYGDIYPCASQKNAPDRKIGNIRDPLHILMPQPEIGCFSDGLTKT